MRGFEFDNSGFYAVVALWKVVLVSILSLLIDYSWGEGFTGRIISN